MIGARTNVIELARRYRQRAQRLDKGVARGLRKATNLIYREQLKNLSGSNKDEPGSYPVPNRTGNLFRSAFEQVHGSDYAIVGNTAAYAAAIHEGTKDGRLKPHPYLDDAAKEVDAFGVINSEVIKEMFAV